MKFELYIMDHLSGDKTKIYSPLLEGESLTLYEKFIEENRVFYKKEIINIDERLELIGNETGLMGAYFKTGAGKFGENLCTLRDRPGNKLRLFFIEYGNIAVILGGGGFKPKTARTTQEVANLESEKNLLGLISITLRRAEKAGHFGIDENGLWSTTNFIYNTEDYG